MLRNYMIIAWRNLLRNKLTSFINISGLAIGMATFMIIAIYVSYELSYDEFFEKKDQIYRYSEYVAPAGEDFKYKSSVGSNRKQYLSQFPEIEKVARLYHSAAGSGNTTFVSTYEADQVNKKTFEESGIYKTEQEFLDIFDIPFLCGDRSSALKDISTIVISKSTAIKYFGKCSGDLLGETMFFGRGYEKSEASFIITGIFEDLPHNTHLNIDMMVSYITFSSKYPERYEDGWLNMKFHTYVLLQESTDLKKIKGEILSRFDTLIAHNFNISIDEYLGDQDEYYRIKPVLRSLSQIYFSPTAVREFWKHGNKSHVLFLISIALITLLIAWINYVNLSLVQIMARAKEAGIRKVIGANQGAIASQFMIEALMANIIALHLSITIISLVLPYLPEFIGKPLEMSIWFKGFPNDVLF